MTLHDEGAFLTQVFHSERITEVKTVLCRFLSYFTRRVLLIGDDCNSYRGPCSLCILFHKTLSGACIRLCTRIDVNIIRQHAAVSLYVSDELASDVTD
jgi:hypothetical protein